MKVIKLKVNHIVVKCKNCKKYDDNAGCCSMGIVKNNSHCEFEPIGE